MTNMQKYCFLRAALLIADIVRLGSSPQKGISSSSLFLFVVDSYFPVFLSMSLYSYTSVLAAVEGRSSYLHSGI